MLTLSKPVIRSLQLGSVVADQGSRVNFRLLTKNSPFSRKSENPIDLDVGSL